MMDDFNFDSLKNLDVPDTWVEKALDVEPKGDVKPVIFVRLTRTLTAVACLVLVCAVSIVLFLNRDSNVLPIDPYKVTESTSSDATTDSTDETSAQHQDKNNFNGLFEFEYIEPTEKATTPDTNNESQSTQKPTQSSESSDPSATLNPTQAAEPTEAPTTQTPTDAPVIKPSDTPIIEPTATPPTELPTDGTGIEGDPTSPAPVYVNCKFPKDMLSNSTEGVYCKIYNSSGELIGDYDDYSVKRKCSVYTYEVYYKAVYEPSAHGLVLSSGSYTCVFYTQSGVTVGSSTIII